jgi:hypothetical protein
LKPRKKNQQEHLQSHKYSCDLQGSNDEFVVEEVNSSSISNSSTPEEDYVEIERQQEILTTCAEHGILFDPRKPSTRNVLDNDIEDVKQALEVFQQRGGHKTIRNPQGWLVDCLNYRYWEDSQMAIDAIFSLIANMIPRNVPRSF